MTVTTRKNKLRRIVKEEVLRFLLREQGTPAEQAKQMGLVKAPGFGNYADPNTGKVTHQSRGGQLIPTKGAGSEKRPQSGITEPPEQDPVAGEPGTTPSTGPERGQKPPPDDFDDPDAPAELEVPERPPAANIPQNQPPADGEPPMPAQRGGPSIGATPEMPQGPKMPESPVAKIARKIVNPDKIKMATSTGDTDTIKTAIDQLAVAKEKISQSREGRAFIPGLEKLQLGLQQQFGKALKQKQDLASFGGR